MLKLIFRHIAFVTVFSVSMMVLLAIAVQTFAALSGEDISNIADGGLDRVKTSFMVAAVFMLLSGFFAAYLVLYGFFLRKASRVFRFFISVLIFALAFVFLWFLVGDWSIGSGAWLLLLGVVSVAISDSLAEIVARRLSDFKWRAGLESDEGN